MYDTLGVRTDGGADTRLDAESGMGFLRITGRLVGFAAVEALHSACRARCLPNIAKRLFL